MANIAGFACQWRSRWFCLTPKKTPFEQIVHVAPKPNQQTLCETKLCAYHIASLGVLLAGDIVYVWFLFLNAQSNQNASAVPSNQLCVWPGTFASEMFLRCWNQWLTKFDLVFFPHVDGHPFEFLSSRHACNLGCLFFCDVKLHRCP